MNKFFKVLFGVPQQQIQTELNEYLENLNTITLDMREAIRAYLNSDMDEFQRLFGRVNEVENRLDTLRRNIEEQIYGHRLLPDTRDDVLTMLENLDKIPNRIQSTTREMLLQHIRIPARLQSSVIELMDRDVQIVQILIQVIHAFLHRPKNVRKAVSELSHHEHAGDVIEQGALRLIFEDETLELAQKMQLYRFVERLGSICDMAEDLGDHLMISALKRLL